MLFRCLLTSTLVCSPRRSWFRSKPARPRECLRQTDAWRTKCDALCALVFGSHCLYTALAGHVAHYEFVGASYEFDFYPREHTSSANVTLTSNQKLYFDIAVVGRCVPFYAHLCSINFCRLCAEFFYFLFGTYFSCMCLQLRSRRVSTRHCCWRPDCCYGANNLSAS